MGSGFSISAVSNINRETKKLQRDEGGIRSTALPALLACTESERSYIPAGRNETSDYLLPPVGYFMQIIFAIHHHISTQQPSPISKPHYRIGRIPIYNR